MSDNKNELECPETEFEFDQVSEDDSGLLCQWAARYTSDDAVLGGLEIGARDDTSRRVFSTVTMEVKR